MERIIMFVRCSEPACPMFTNSKYGRTEVEGDDVKATFRRAHAMALEHAWTRRGHRVEVIHEGRVKATAKVVAMEQKARDCGHLTTIPIAVGGLILCPACNEVRREECKPQTDDGDAVRQRLRELGRELRGALTEINREACDAVRHQQKHGVYPEGLSDGAALLLRSLPSDPAEHRMEHHCLVDDYTDECVICGVLHGVECPDCKRRGYHGLPCIMVKPARALSPIEGGGR